MRYQKRRPGMNRGHRLDQIGVEPISYAGYPEWYINSIEKLKGYCLWCGKKLPNKRYHYCPPKDEHEYSHKDRCRCAVHDLRVTPVRRFVHQKFKFECQECGKHFPYFTPAGAELPVHGGEVHHSTPLKDGGEDSIENMELLCEKHHKEKTYPKKEIGK